MKNTAGHSIRPWRTALCVIPLCLALYPIFFGQFYLTGDMRDVFVPLENFFHQEMLAARLPTWNPDSAWGYPVLASAQIGFFYPPLLIARLLPLPLYLPLILFGHLIALAGGTYLFFRHQLLSPGAAYFSSMAFTLGSFIFQHLTHLNIIVTSAWLPWQLLAAHRLARRQHARAADIATLALALGLPFLAGQLHMPTMTALVTFAYYVYVRHQHRRSLGPSLITAGVVALMATAITAAQLFPTAELLAHSSRGPQGDFNINRANQHSFPLYHVPTVLFPRFFGNDDTYWGKRLQIEYGIFIGTIPLMLALWHLIGAARGGGISRPSRSPRDPRNNSMPAKVLPTRGPKKEQAELIRQARARERFFRWLLIITFLLALGSWSPFRLIGFEPTLWIFSAPARWLLFTTFALALFAGRGLDELPRHTPMLQRLSKYATLTLILLTIGFTVVIFRLPDDAPFLTVHIPTDAARPREYYSEKLTILLASARQSSLSLASPFTALPIISLAAFPFIIRRRHARGVLIWSGLAELIIIAATTNPSLPWSHVTAPPTTVADLPDSVSSGLARIVSIRPPGDTGRYLTNPQSRADSQRREEYRQLLLPLGHSLFGIPGVEWPASLDLAGHDELLDRVRNLTNPQAAERANIGAVLTANEEAAAVTIHRLNPVARASLPGGTTTYQAITPTHTRITVSTTTPTSLTIRDSFYPGWQAYQDGKSVPITLAEEIFRRLNVDKGEHQIDLYYRPASVYLGLAISAPALLICGIIALKRKSA